MSALILIKCLGFDSDTVPTPCTHVYCGFSFLCIVVARQYKTKMYLNSSVRGKLNAALISYNSSDRYTFTGFSVIEQFVLGFTDN